MFKENEDFNNIFDNYINLKKFKLIFIFNSKKSR